MTEVFLISLSSGHDPLWAKPPANYREVWDWIKQSGELRVQDDRPTLDELQQPDFGVPISFNPDHIVSIARFPCLP